MPHLPYPSPQAVESFKRILKDEFDIELTDAEALDWATRTLKLWYFQHYGTHSLCMPTGHYRKDPGPDKH